MKNDDILRAAGDRFDECQSADLHNREEAYDDLEFLAGEQWPADILTSRQDASRPTLTINRMPQFLRQVTGDIRRSNPAVDILPSDDEASDEIAEIYDGLIRQIEADCGASSVYERAAEGAAACGMGYFRLRTEYEGPDSFAQKILIESIANPFSVHVDPEAKDPTRKDARFLFITEKVPEDVFADKYPKASKTDWSSGSLPTTLQGWHDGETVTVAEYYWKEPYKKTLYMQGGQISDRMVPGVPIDAQRECEDYKVKWAKLSPDEVLEGPKEIPGRNIPVLAVIGEEMHVGDRVVRTSVIRYAKDSQRMYNYWNSAMTEVIALQPKAPYKVTPKQIEGFEGMWEDANTENYPYLLYNPDEKAPGAPQREAPPVASSGIMAGLQIAAEDMKATTGIFDAGLGDQSNETSGVAIKQRQIESDISTSIYVDNLSKAIEQAGRIMVEWIPVIYDTTRVIRILGKDSTPKSVEINKPHLAPGGVQVLENPLDWGKYAVRVVTGPSYSTQRQEAAQSMIEFVRAFPAAAPVIGDLVAASMDWPGAKELAERLKKMVPSELLDAEPDDMSPEQQQAMQAQAQQAAQQAQVQQAMQQAEIRKTMAEASESEADAQKAQAEANNTQLEMALKTGQLDAAVTQMVNLAVARALSAQAAQAQQPYGAQPF
jgi:hypothetical protein